MNLPAAGRGVEVVLHVEGVAVLGALVLLVFLGEHPQVVVLVEHFVDDAARAHGGIIVTGHFLTHATHLIGRGGATHGTVDPGAQRRHAIMEQSAERIEHEGVDRAVLVLLLGPLALTIVLEFYPIVDAIDTISQRIWPRRRSRGRFRLGAGRSGRRPNRPASCRTRRWSPGRRWSDSCAVSVAIWPSAV